MANEKSDWSKIDSILGYKQSSPDEVHQPKEISLSGDSVPLDHSIKQQDPVGILAKLQQGRLTRKASLSAMKARYDSQIEVLCHQLTQAVVVEKAKVDVLADQYLKEIDSQHLAVLSELGLRNKETRERALLKLTQSTVDRLKEVQEMDWPEAIIHETIGQILQLKTRAVGEIMSELGMSEGDG